MKLKQLLEQLTEAYKQLGNIDVLMSCDAEGNRFSPVQNADCDNCAYKHVQDASFGGTIKIGLAVLTDTYVNAGFGTVDVITDGQRCVVLWPQ